MGASLDVATMSPALTTPKRLSPTIIPDATNAPMVPVTDDGAHDGRAGIGPRAPPPPQHPVGATQEEIVKALNLRHGP